MSRPEFQRSQLAMARYLRDPQGQSAPAGMDARRLAVYADLVYNNIESFIRSGFPVLHSLYTGPAWQALVRAFLREHHCQTPYFLEISQEFVRYLLEIHQPGADDPPFLAELAHYEWAELALAVAAEDVPPNAATDDPVPRLSPLAWSLAYRFPVHRIGPDCRPQAPGELHYLVVYRDRDDQVRFLEVNAATARLLELLRDNEMESADQLLLRLAGELGADSATTLEFGREQIAMLVTASVVWLADRGAGPVARP